MSITRGVDAIYADLIAAHKRHILTPSRTSLNEVRQLHTELARIVGRRRTYILSSAAIREARQHIRDEEKHV